jgi:riboflavin transporter FmnP
MGQVGGLILLLWTLGVYFLSKSNPVWSAGCFALGTIIKLTPVLVVPLLLLRRQWKWLAAYAGWMAFFLGISLWRFGWQNHVIYFAKVLPTMSCGYPLATNVSLATVLQSLHAGGALLSDELVMQAQQNMPVWVCLLAKVIGLGIYLGTLLLFWKNKDSQRGLVEELAILTLVSVLVSPVAWRHSYVVTLLPILLIWMGARRQVFSTGKYMLLFLATITIGTAIPYYLLIHLKRSVLDVALVGAVPAAAIILLLICLQLHTRNATIEIS